MTFQCNHWWKTDWIKIALKISSPWFVVVEATDNPDSEQFREEYRAIAVESLFSYSKGGNCRSDSDVFLLKLSNVTTAAIPQVTRQENTSILWKKQ